MTTHFGFVPLQREAIDVGILLKGGTQVAVAMQLYSSPDDYQRPLVHHFHCAGHPMQFLDIMDNPSYASFELLPHVETFMRTIPASRALEIPGGTLAPWDPSVRLPRLAFTYKCCRCNESRQFRYFRLSSNAKRFKGICHDCRIPAPLPYYHGEPNYLDLISRHKYVTDRDRHEATFGHELQVKWYNESSDMLWNDLDRLDRHNLLKHFYLCTMLGQDFSTSRQDAMNADYKAYLQLNMYNGPPVAPSTAAN